ncbi:MAG: hypothetical protein MRZ79_03925 [Bacteroidia bacterium]|nr:hypothetical protein [Bacteroidia bacterium]
MKVLTGLLYTSTLLIAVLLISCQPKGPKEVNPKKPKGDKASLIHDASYINDGKEIRPKRAENRITIYEQIYGADSSARFLSKRNDCKSCKNLKGRLIIPRYYQVNSKSFLNFLNKFGVGEDVDESAEAKCIPLVYGSFGVKRQGSGDNLIPSLILHNIRPYNNGLLKSPDNDNFREYIGACPPNCSEKTTNALGNPVTAKEATKMVERYNCFYDTLASVTRFLSNGTDSVLIARYFAFSQEDLMDIKKILKGRSNKYFFISLSAVPRTSYLDQPIPNTYVSDLIFHFDRPPLGGYPKPLKGNTVADDDDDEFLDITEPCPNACG